MRRIDEKCPPPPEALVGALQDQIHPTSGDLICASPIKTRKVHRVADYKCKHCDGTGYRQLAPSLLAVLDLCMHKEVSAGDVACSLGITRAAASSRIARLLTAKLVKGVWAKPKAKFPQKYTSTSEGWAYVQTKKGRGV